MCSVHDVRPHICLLQTNWWTDYSIPYLTVVRMLLDLNLFSNKIWQVIMSIWVKDVPCVCWEFVAWKQVCFEISDTFLAKLASFPSHPNCAHTFLFVVSCEPLVVLSSALNKMLSFLYLSHKSFIWSNLSMGVKSQESKRPNQKRIPLHLHGI